ncbi:pyridoxamine 5'-phosphate oxidase [Melanomma pulvis-pyrius CBS 109.77]|uniref:pyridoxal 5'-phosphate synthase n=1 Tax=Melanomma pulvis-pyrius CBS 109.77 TaxID=1314802 RepID=A0A6A6XSM8_9PLEO|nr:pyridoxamine 5'-phosphate oxidase [Melanomma pulvis-pyrius CBS 109.77]
MLHSAKNHNVSPDQLSSQPQNPSTSAPSKLIFAPTGGSSDPTKAVQYEQGTLDLADLSPSPLTQFSNWFSAATEAGVYQPETVTLATAALPSGRVSARVVFMKELDSRGFVVYSNWDTSRKAADINSNPQAALTFWWREMERQVRVEGRTERLSDEESQVYYDTRARGSRIGAWASPQSKVLGGREELEDKVKEVEKRFEGQEKIPVPGFWGGIRVVPDVVEFWQGRESRLHDRLRYVKEGEEWKVERLSP